MNFEGCISNGEVPFEEDVSMSTSRSAFTEVNTAVLFCDTDPFVAAFFDGKVGLMSLA